MRGGPGTLKKPVRGHALRNLPLYHYKYGSLALYARILPLKAILFKHKATNP